MLINALRVNIGGHQCGLITRWTHKYLHCLGVFMSPPFIVFERYDVCGTLAEEMIKYG